jgi:DNA replication and repair protein RecF
LIEPAAPVDALPQLALTRLAARNFRNIERVDLDLAPGLTVVSGSNGHGKTAILEAIYFAATSRSFRTSKAAELVRHGEAVASVRASFVELGDEASRVEREQLAAVEGKRVVVKLDGNKPPTLGAYATRSPVVVFHPQELALSSGPAAGRRLMLDRLALFRDAESADARGRYAHALKQRRRLLQRDDAKPAEVDVFEELCARHGAALTRARRQAVDALEPAVLDAFRRIAAPELTLDLAYRPGGSEDEDVARAELAAARLRDTHRETAGFGPHRDDLELRLDGRLARVVASQGQHRAVTLALKAAEAATVAALRGLWPMLLLDDVSSELDRARTAALFDFLGDAHGQIVLTTTRPELIEAPRVARADVEVVEGRVSAPAAR